MLDDLLRRIVRALDARAIPYMVIGGQAVLVYGEPRLTRDVDITLGVDVDELPTVLECVGDARLTPLVQPDEFVPKTMVLPCTDTTSGMRVDLVFSFTPYERDAIARARRIDVAGTTVSYVSREDLLVHKLLAGRARDLEDVRSVLIRQADLDRDFVSNTLADFDESLGRDLVARFDEVIRSL